MSDDTLRQFLNENPNGGRVRFPPWESKHNPIYRKERNNAICNEYHRGSTITALAEKWGITERTVRRILRDNGIKAKKEEMAGLVEKILIGLNAGVYKSTIAETLNISRPTLYKVIKDHGIIKEDGIWREGMRK